MSLSDVAVRPPPLASASALAFWAWNISSSEWPTLYSPRRVGGVEQVAHDAPVRLVEAFRLHVVVAEVSLAVGGYCGLDERVFAVFGRVGWQKLWVDAHPLHVADGRSREHLDLCVEG